jgi:DNA invertase Pin-like site-specific DNA recombinase
MRAALYARVSTTDQNCGIQVGELLAFCKAREWPVIMAKEDWASGGKADRSGLVAIMEAARRREIDVVLVWKLDRFGRSTVDLVNNIRELEALGVRFISTTQGIDTDKSNPVSRFLLTILSAVAELEREMICERVRAGMLRAKSKGVKIGPPERVYDRERAREMRFDGLSIRAIASALGVGRGTIHRLIKGVPEGRAETAIVTRSGSDVSDGAVERPRT